MSIVEIELPGVWLDNVVEDTAPAVIGATPTLVNYDPEPGETRVPKGTNISFELATLAASGTVDLSATMVYVAGVLVFNAGAPGTGWTSSYSNPQADVLRVVLNPNVDFASEQVVLVRVVSKAVGDPGVLDTSYSFTIADTTAPRLVSAQALELQRVRVTFSENVLETSAANVDSALNPANWQLDRLGDYVVPIVSATVASVEPVTSSIVDLLTDIPLTPSGNYRVTAAVLEDTSGNPIVAPNDVVDFVAWTPPVPEGRVFDLYTKLPQKNRSEDDTLDLLRFIGCFQEVVTLLLYDIDRFPDILDPDRAPEQYVDTMLRDLGNPFAFELSLIDKRRLAQVLVDMYRLKGTKPGIESVVRFFMGIEVSVDPYNGSETAWLLGESELGIDTFLGTSDTGLIYSFVLTVPYALTDTQRKQLRDIAEYMKPAHEHLVRIVEPVIPVILDHMELGLSELGDTWILH